MHFLSFSQTQVLFKKPICKEVLDSFRFLTSRSLLFTQDPGKNGEDAIGSLGELASAARRNPASSPAFAARKGRGRSPHSLWGRFQGSVGSRRGLARGLAGGRRQRSLQARLQRSCGEAGPMPGTKGPRGSYWNRLVCHTAAERSWRGSSAAVVPMAHNGQSTRASGAARARGRRCGLK
jgi:hypothetical protein